MPDQYLTLAEIADRAGIKVSTARQYHKSATANRAAGRVVTADLPAPDITLGLTPGWAPETVGPWLDARVRRQS